MAHFPNETPHVIANRKAARVDDDKGSLYIVRPDADRVIVTVRAPGDARESAVSIPIEIFRKLVADYHS